ncbi:hypothetical protein ACFL35_11415 [Candidatus Riflebacteria bacterium]
MKVIGMQGKYFKQFIWCLFFSIFSFTLCTVPAVAQEDGDEEVRIVLIVDDSFNTSLNNDVSQVLGKLGVEFETFKVNRKDPLRQRPTLEQMQRYFATFWFTSGKFDEFCGTDAKLVAKYLNEKGKLIVMGALTGNSLSWNFIAKDTFGFQYQGSLEYPVNVEELFGKWSQALKVDYGQNYTGACPFYVLMPEDVKDKDLTLKSCAVGNIGHNGYRSIWMGFNFQDLDGEESQKRILERCLWFLDYFAEEDSRLIQKKKLGLRFKHLHNFK